MADWAPSRACHDDVLYASDELTVKSATVPHQS